MNPTSSSDWNLQLIQMKDRKPKSIKFSFLGLISALVFNEIKIIKSRRSIEKCSELYGMKPYVFKRDNTHTSGMIEI